MNTSESDRDRGPSKAPLQFPIAEGNRTQANAARVDTTSAIGAHISLSDSLPDSRTGWKRFNGFGVDSVCPVCNGSRKDRDCRQSPKTGFIHCRGDHQNTSFEYVEDDSLGFGMYRLSGSTGTRRPRRSAAPIKEVKLLALSGKERDRQFRKISFASGMGSAARTDLTRRGVDDVTIDQWHTDSLVWSWSSGAAITGVTPQLPGIDPRSGLTRNFRGLTVGVQSVNGNIIGAQFRGDSWYWVSSEKIGGIGPRLQNDETPIGIYGSVNCTELNFAEGFLKPLIASDRHDITCVGAAGGNFAGSPIQLKATIEKTGATRFVLNADAGAIANRHVLGSYSRFYEWMKDNGYTLEIRWWSQRTKSDGDIDEINTATFAEANIISWKEFKTLWTVETTEGVANDLRQIKRTLDHMADVAGRIGYDTPKPQINVKLSTAKAPAATIIPNTETSAIVPYGSYPIPNSIPWVVCTDRGDVIPTAEEKGDRELILYFDKATVDYPALNAELKNKGYTHLLDRSAGGEGKSHRSGELLDSWEDSRGDIEGMEESNAYYIANDYRNPTTSTLEAIPERVSGANISYVPGKVTPSGKPQRKRTPSGEIPDIAGACCMDAKIQQIQSKSDIKIERGVKSTFCNQLCPIAVFKCPYLQAMQEQQDQVVLRTHISGATQDNTQPLLVIDEAERVLTSKRILEGTLPDILHERYQFERDNPALANLYRPVVNAIVSGLTQAIEYGAQHGLTQQELIRGTTDKDEAGGLHTTQFLPSRNELLELFNDAYMTTFISMEHDIWNGFNIESLFRAMHKSNDPNSWEETIDDMKNSGVPIVPNAVLQQMTAEPIYRTFLAIMDDSTNQSSRSSISVNGSKVELATRDRNAMRAIHKAGMVLYMDATANPRTLARKARVRRSDMVMITSYRPNYNNLKVVVAEEIGNPCTDRGPMDSDGNMVRQGHYDIQQRIIKAVKEIVAGHSGSTGLIDYKKFMATYANIERLITGYCMHDNRGSNAFMGCDRFISVPLATANLSSTAQDYQLMSGFTPIVGRLPVEWSPIQRQEYERKLAGFWRYVQDCQVNELIQDCYRLRAQHRRDKQLTHYIFAPMSDRQIEHFMSHFPGAVIERVKIGDICPEAERKGKQTERRIVSEMFEKLTAGVNPKLDDIASAVGLSGGRVSQVAKALINGGFKTLRKTLVLLLEAINDKTKVSELDDEALALVEFLPAVAQELRVGTMEPQDALEIVTAVIDDLPHEQAVAVFAALDSSDIATFTTEFLPMLPDNAVAWIMSEFPGKALGPIPASTLS